MAQATVVNRQGAEPASRGSNGLRLKRVITAFVSVESDAQGDWEVVEGPTRHRRFRRTESVGGGEPTVQNRTIPEIHDVLFRRPPHKAGQDYLNSFDSAEAGFFASANSCVRELRSRAEVIQMENHVSDGDAREKSDRDSMCMVYKDILDARAIIDKELAIIRRHGRFSDVVSVVFGGVLPTVAIVIAMTGLFFGAKEMVDVWTNGKIADSRAETEADLRTLEDSIVRKFGSCHVVYGSVVKRFDRESFEEVTQSAAGPYWVSRLPLTPQDIPFLAGKNAHEIAFLESHVSISDWRDSEMTNPLPDMRVYVTNSDDGWPTVVCQILGDLPEGRRVEARVLMTGPASVLLRE